MLRFTHVQHAQVRGFRARGPVDTLLKTIGYSTPGVALVGNDFKVH